MRSVTLLGMSVRRVSWLLAAAFVVTGCGTDSDAAPDKAEQAPVEETAPSTTAAPTSSTSSAPPATSVSYRSCADAEAAGAAPIHQGEPGYSTNLDRDGDGIACDQEG